MQAARQLLRKHHITPTTTRLQIWAFVRHNPTHPTAEDIYLGLQKQDVSISRATVYNTMRTFVEHGLLTSLRGADDLVHYDPMVSPHAHFLCKSCRCLWDIPFDFDYASLPELRDCEVHSAEIVIHGFCPTCAKKQAASDPETPSDTTR